MMTHYYLDTSVLLVYTLASGKELERYPFVTKLFELIVSSSNFRVSKVCESIHSLTFG